MSVCGDSTPFVAIKINGKMANFFVATYFSISEFSSARLVSNCRFKFSRSAALTRARSSYNARKFRILANWRSYSWRKFSDINCVSRSANELSICVNFAFSCNVKKQKHEPRRKIIIYIETKDAILRYFDTTYVALASGAQLNARMRSIYFCAQ